MIMRDGEENQGTDEEGRQVAGRRVCIDIEKAGLEVGMQGMMSCSDTIIL